MPNDRQAPREVELKLLLDPATLGRIRRSGALTRLPHIEGQGRSTVQNLTSLYWDTPDHALARAGIALRVRRDGGRVIQTLKAADGPGGLVANRAEDEAMRPASDALAPPDLDLVADTALRDRARAAIGAAALEPVFESAISRVVRTLDDDRGGRFEAALDLGELRLPHASGETEEAASPVPRQTVCEIELEHRAGPVTTLFDVASGLAQRYPVKVGTESKVKRGYAMAIAARAGKAALPLPVRAGRSPLRPGMTIAEAYGALVAHAARQMAANQRLVTASRDPAGIHQIRVAMRRLRSVRSAFKGALPDSDSAHLVVRVKRLFRVLGHTRDLDIFCTETIPGLVRGAGDTAPSLVALEAAARELRSEAWDAAIRAVESKAFTRLLLDAGTLSARLQDRSGSQERDGSALPLRDFAVDRLTRRRKQVLRQAHQLEDLNDEARHDLRKRLKTLRYEAAFFGPLWPRAEVKAFMRPLKQLQDKFGAINDAATATLVAQQAARRIGGEQAAQAAGFIGGWYAAEGNRAFEQVIAAWPSFEALPCFWDAPAASLQELGTI